MKFEERKKNNGFEMFEEGQRGPWVDGCEEEQRKKRISFILFF